MWTGSGPEVTSMWHFMTLKQKYSKPWKFIKEEQPPSIPMPNGAGFPTLSPMKIRFLKRTKRSNGKNAYNQQIRIF